MCGAERYRCPVRGHEGQDSLLTCFEFSESSARGSTHSWPEGHGLLTFASQLEPTLEIVNSSQALGVSDPSHHVLVPAFTCRPPRELGLHPSQKNPFRLTTNEVSMKEGV